MADNTVSIRVVVRDLTRGGVGSARNSISGLARSLAMLGGGAGAIVGLTGVTAAAQQLAGAALVLPGALSAAAAVVSTFKIALGGVAEALGAASGGASGAGASMAGYGRQVRDANKAIEQARRGVADADRQLEEADRAVEAASRGVASAERDAARAAREHERALQDEEAAHRAVDAARRAALRSLEDLDEAQSDAARSLEGAELALKRAVENQLKTQRDVKATYLDRAEAAHRVKDAEDARSDAERKATDSSAEYAEAQAKGVEGSKEVVAAQEAVRAAQERTAAAAEAVIAADEGLADARRGVEDAQRGVADAERGVEDAHRAVADAVQNLQDVYAQQAEAAGAAAGGVDAYAAALAKLSPEARELVETLRGLSDEWQTVQWAVQDAAFDGVSEQIGELAGVYIPLLRDGLGSIAGELNSMADYGFDALMDPDTVAAINTVLGNTALMLDGAETALGDFLAGWAGLSAIGSEFLPAFGEWLAEIAARFREWVETDPEAVRQFIQDGIDGFSSLGEIIGNVVDFFAALFEGLSSGTGTGEGFLDMLADMTESMVEFAESEFAQEVLRIIGELARLIIETIPIWGPVAAGMAAVAAAMWLVNWAMNANIIGVLITGLTMLVAAFYYAWNNSETFRNILIGVWDAISGAFIVARDAIVIGWQWIVDKVTWAGGLIGGAVSGMWDGLVGGLKWAVNAAIGLLNDLIYGANFIIGGLNNINPFGSIPMIPYVPYLARGGVASGLAMVGEAGPELVDLPTGSRVHTAGDTRRRLDAMAGGPGGGQAGVMELRVAPGADSALAALLERMVRTGELQLMPAAG